MPNPNLIWKAELARRLNISIRTLSRWLNEIEFDELQKLHYRKTQKYLTKAQLDYLFPTGINEIHEEVPIYRQNIDSY
jgi:transcriptional regulator with XRE-family HTH domain